MKYLVFFAVIALHICGCASNGQQPGETQKPEQQVVADSLKPPVPEKPAQKISGAVADSLLGKLCKKWYSKKFVGNDGDEHYEEASNNEELMLMRDMTFKAIDRVVVDSINGTWQIITSNTIQLTDATGDAHRFQITELSDASLVTKVLDGEEDVSIYYSTTK